MLLASVFFENIWDFIKLQAGKLIATGTIIIISLIILFVIKITIKNHIKKSNISKKKKSITLATMLLSVSQYVILIVGIIIILSVWGINVTSILVGAGIITIAVSFGAQKMIADIISGFCIVFENYYDIDDVVEIDGFKGTITEIGIKSTKIVNWKNEVKIIANSEITTVINYSRAPSVGIVDISIAYEENTQKVIDLLEEKLIIIKDQFEQIVEGPNVIGVTSLADSACIIRITVKTLSEQHYPVERAIKKYVKELFEQEGIKIPYPQLEIHDGNNNK